MRDDPVHLLQRAQMLAQHADRGVAEHQPVEGVSAELRVGTGVGSLAVDHHLPLLRGKCSRRMVVERGGVDHHRGVDPVKRAGLDQVDLSTADLLSRSPEDRHAQPSLLSQGSQRDAGADCGGGDDVVTAGVPHLGECVVLRTHHDVRAFPTGPSRERGREPVRRSLDVEAMQGQEFGASGCRAVLGVGQLWVGGESMGQPDEVVGDRLDELADAG